MGDINASLQSSLSGSTDGVRNIFPKVLFLNVYGTKFLTYKHCYLWIRLMLLL